KSLNIIHLIELINNQIIKLYDKGFLFLYSTFTVSKNNPKTHTYIYNDFIKKVFCRLNNKLKNNVLIFFDNHNVAKNLNNSNNLIIKTNTNITTDEFKSILNKCNEYFKSNICDIINF